MDGRMEAPRRRRRVLLIRRNDERNVRYSARLYDAEVAAVDEEVRLLFDELRRRRFLDHAVTVLTADHGEEFMEHEGLGHARALYEESVHVPLVVSTSALPAGRHIAADVSLVDVAPTVLELLHLPPEPAFEGRSLVALGTHDDGPASDVVLEFEPIFTDTLDRRAHARGLVRGRQKLLLSPSGRAEAYDLSTDPAEQKGEPPGPGSAAVAMADALAVTERRLAERAGRSAPVRPIDDALAQRLKALGYTR